MNQKAVSWMLRILLAATASVMLFHVQPLVAQVDTGSISGTITDASGAVVKGATVKIKNEGTAAELTTTAGGEGAYVFSPVRIGSYTLTASAAGFQTTVAKGVVVNVSANVLVNMALKTGATTETVEVTSAAPVLQTQDASVGQVVDTRNVNNLPLNGRNFTFLAQLAAGVNSPQADTRGNAASGAFSANGLRAAQNNYMLDGVDNNSDTVDFLNGTNYVVLPPLDAIDEFKVQTSGFSAEFGRSGAAVLNATIKSGTNSFHGAAWEFFRNDKFDAADYFERNGAKKGALRQNQFGASIGGPIVKNKIFFFGDYEGLRRIQGTILSGSVPTAAEMSSLGTPFADFSDLITGQSGTQTDALGRTMPVGTILDPATTRQLSPGVYVRDPFLGPASTCTAGTTAYTLAACDLNKISVANRLDPNAIALLKLYPKPTNSSLFGNFANSPKLNEHKNAFDARVDFNLSEKNQVFARFSYADDPQLIPGIFGGVADGGGFQQGTQTAKADQAALAWTHVFSSNLINVARVGLNHLHTTRVSPSANNLKGAGGNGLPADYGIQGIPQQAENGGLPAFGINGLQTLGSNAFLPSDEITSTYQITDDLTKIYGKHTFKMGFEVQHVNFSTLQPPWSRGQFDYSGLYTEIPGVGKGNTGRAQFLLIPKVSTVGGPDYVGGPSGNGDDGGLHNGVFVSNISLTDNGKNYYGGYINDDWKVTPKLTVNLGLRWDFFGLVYEHHGAQANFVPRGAPSGSPLYLIPNPVTVSDSFTALLKADKIDLVTGNQYGKGLGNSQKLNLAPRFGFAYQVSSKLVARGGFGLFYNGFENRGFSPNLGENYPFQFNFQFQPPDAGHPITYSGCTSSSATPIGSATLETGFSCTPLKPDLVNASGLALRGIQFNYITPYSMGGNFTLQYQLTPTLSIQAGYVTSLARHLEVFPSSNNVTQIVDTTQSAKNFVPFPDFGQGSSYAATIGNSFYHGLQVKGEKRFSGGLNFLATYTWSKTMTDAGDLLNGGSTAGFRAPDVPGAGVHYDYGLAAFDIRNVFHFSGGYELPFGKGKRFLANSGGVANKLLGGWSINTSIVLQGGQPITLTCPTGTANGTGCYDLVVPGQSFKRGIHIDAKGNTFFFGNRAAFAQPCALGAGGVPIPNKPTGCVALTGLAALGGPPTQLAGPTFKRMDFSTFKDMQLSERFKLQFRAEFFNLFNHPNFNAPGFGGNGVVAISGSTDFTNANNFGQVGSTRDAPYDPRQIQFALKLYY